VTTSDTPGYVACVLPFRLRYTDQIVAAFLLASATIVVLTVLLVVRSQDLFKRRVSYWTMFDDGGGIKADTPVKIAGIEVGKVKRVELTDKNTVEVQFEILEDYTNRITLDDGVDCEKDPEPKTRCGARVTMSVPAGIGAFLPTGGGLTINVGNMKNRRVEEAGFVKSEKQEGFADFLNRLQKEDVVKNAQVIVAEIATLLQRINDVEGPIWKSIQNVEVVTTRARDGKGVVGEALKDGSAMQRQVQAAIDSLNRSLENVEKSSSDVAVVTEDIRGQTPEIRAFVKNLEKFSEDAKEVGKKMNDFATESKKVPPDVREAVANLNARIDDLGVMINGLKNTWPFSMGDEEPGAGAPAKKTVRPPPKPPQ
jgi:phospholipid/cholesterol/gamma-HCH transport system substrate-binding protein